MTKTTKYYAVSEDVSYTYDNQKEIDEATIWTVSTDLNQCGWETDSGNSRYGLTRKEAQFLADAANEKIERENVRI